MTKLIGGRFLSFFGLLVLVFGTLAISGYKASGEPVEIPAARNIPTDAKVETPYPLPNITYIEESDGRFSICESDFKNNTLLKWKGVYIPRQWLPEPDPLPGFRSASTVNTEYVYFRGTGSSTGDTSISWFYGPVPFPLKEMDPPIRYGISCDRPQLLIGFFVRGFAYALKVVENPRLKNKSLRRLNWSSPYRFVELPAHRKDELKKLLSELIENPDEVLNDEGRDTPNVAGHKK